MKICPLGAEFFHADRLTGRPDEANLKNDEANSRFSQLREDT